jgi:NitT/TauT family transport system substrate-binding protein
VTSAYADFDPNLDIAAYFAKDDVDAELEEKFVAAMQKSLEYAQENPDEVRRILGTYTQTPAEVLEKITLPTFPTEMNRDAIERLAEAAESYGVLSKTPDFDKLLP